MLTADRQLASVQRLDVATLEGCLEVLLECSKRWNTSIKVSLELLAFGRRPTSNRANKPVATTVHHGINETLRSRSVDTKGLCVKAVHVTVHDLLCVLTVIVRCQVRGQEPQFDARQIASIVSWSSGSLGNSGRSWAGKLPKDCLWSQHHWTASKTGPLMLRGVAWRALSALT